MKFYNHKDIKKKYSMMAKLASSLLWLSFSNSETQLWISLNDDTIEGLMLWKKNSDLLNINDDKIFKKYVKEMQNYWKNKSKRK